MAKDDYYTVVAKILVYLYKKIKGDPVEPEYLMYGTKDFPITEEYFLYILEMMQRQNFIEGLFILKTMGGTIYKAEWNNIRILPPGIDYLKENSTIRKVCEGLKEAAPLASFFAEF